MDTPQLGPVEHTETGFEIIRFKDRYDTPCTLQMSSLADFEQPGISAVWLGPVKAEPRCLARDAAPLGVECDTNVGWVTYPLPEEVSFTTRAHLSRDNVEALIGHLENWLATGHFGTP